MTDAITRRTLIKTIGAAGLLVPLQAPSAAPYDGNFAYVGCRTTRERNARGDGIGVFRIGPDGAWTLVQTVTDLVNPSFLAFDRTQRFLYAVHGDRTEVSAFAIDPSTGTLSFLGRQPAHGLNPVHVSIDPTNRFAVVVNHLAGADYQPNLAVFPLQADGSLGAVADVVPLSGKIGPHRIEQPHAKPHQALFDPAGKFILVPDKGCDLVRSFRLGADGRLSEAAPPAPAREGAGPRHAAFHPTLPCAYVVNELDCTIAAYRYDRGTGALSPLQWLPSIPESYFGLGRASEIEVSGDGRFLYASNRGPDSIALYAIDQTTGFLSPAGWHASGGRTPRFFALGPQGKTLYAANEDSDSIVALTVDGASGSLADGGTVARTGSPTCILFRAGA